METETYTVTFFGLEQKYYSTIVVGDIWKQEARAVYLETGIIIVGEVFESYFVEPNNDECGGENIIIVQTIRIPHRQGTELECWNAYRSVVNAVKKRLGDPRVGLIIKKASLVVLEKGKRN
jgi:hypothetical protein